MRRDVLEHNEFLSSLDVRVDDPDAYYDALGFLHIRGDWVDPRRIRYYRVFNSFWTRGGRWYGTWWQSLPKAIRRHLLINRTPVVEHDYSACHLRLLYAREGIALPRQGFDPYEIAGFPRSHVKLGFNVMLNTGDERSAGRAIARELSLRQIENPYSQAALLMGAVREHFNGLDHCWCTGIGLRLQGVDAEICRRVQHRLRRLGIPVLSVHDSFIVPAFFDTALADVMEDEMRRACWRARE